MSDSVILVLDQCIFLFLLFWEEYYASLFLTGDVILRHVLLATTVF